MRVRLTQLEIAGADRRVDFTPGLNIITGPLTTGKTTLLRLCRVLLGTGIEPGTYPREVRDTVRAISGRLLLGDKTFGIVRPFVSTTTAKVDIAWEGGALRLPALQPDETADTTFARWLLTELGLPELRVPSAPTLPESTPTPVTISDYLA